MRTFNNSLNTVAAAMYKDPTVLIYAPMIYTAPCIMFLVRAYHYEGKWEAVGPWKFLGPMKWHRGDRSVPIGAFRPKLRGWGSRCIKELNRPARAIPPHYKTY
jgi:hypothetical protein